MLKYTAIGLVVLVSCFLQVKHVDAQANYSITGSVVGAFEIDGVTVHNPVPNTAFNVGSPLVYKVDLTLHATNFNPSTQRGFDSISYDITMTGNSLNNAVPNGKSGWKKSTDPVWQFNQDDGTPNDLKDIIAIVDVRPTQISESLGQNPNGTFLGSIYVNWDGTGPETLIFNPTLGSFVDTNGQGVFDNTKLTLSQTSLVFGGAVPEPSTIILMGLAFPALGFMAMRSRRKHRAA